MAVANLANWQGEIEGDVAAPSGDHEDNERWDRFVACLPGSDVVQTTAWAEAKRALGFEVSQVMVSRNDGQFVGGGQITIKRFGPLGALGFVARGPMVGEACPEQAARVLAEIERRAKAQRVHHLIVQPPVGGAHVAAALAARGYAEDAPAVAPTATLTIDLRASLDSILAGMSASKRYEVRRSQREGVEVQIGGPDALDGFFPLYEASAQRQGFRPLSRSYLRHHWQALHSRGWAQLFFAFHQGEPLAAMWVTAFGDTVTDRLVGWSGEKRRLQPNVAMTWHVIRWAKERGFRFFDLGGIDRRYAELILADQPFPEGFMKSPAAFKREFGAKPVLLPTAAQRAFNPLAQRLVQSLYPKLAQRKSFLLLLHRLRNG